MTRTRTRRIAPIVLAAALVPALALAAGSKGRVLTWTGPGDEIARLAVEGSVGDVTVRGEDGADTVSVKVTLKPRRSGLPIVGSTRKGEREIEAARLEVDRDDGSVEVALEGVDDDRHFEERWEIVVPARLLVEIENGVGDIAVKGVAGGADIESGVGDVIVSRCGGRIEVENGVGDIRIVLPETEAGGIEVSSGVGDCEIRLPGHTVRGKGLGCDASWKGTGKTAVDAESGVGDVVVVLKGSAG